MSPSAAARTRSRQSPAEPTSLAPTHPLRSASWIWPGGQMYNYNTYAQFRKDFELATVAPRATLFVTADQSYRLWINGRYVCRGPARGYQSHWPFDELDVAEYLRPGHNWLAVQAYNPGISTFQYRHQGTAGFLLALRCGNATIVSDSSWAKRRAPGVRRHTARYSLQLAFQEDIDTSAYDWSWTTREQFDPGSWAHAPERLTSWDDCFAFGRPPYDSVEPRSIPMLREVESAPVSAVCETSGKCGDGWRDWENISWGWVAEAKKSEWRTGGPRTSLDSGALRVRIDATGANAFRAVTLDCGEYKLGTIVLEADGAVGGEIVDLHCCEGLVGGRPALHEPGSACQVGQANRLHLRPGASEHDYFHLLGMRYVTVVVRGSTVPLDIRVRVRSAGYPFTMRGQFECSDPVLNQIHAACQRTQQVCSLDAYMDTPWREQAQWWGDARVQARNTFYLDGDARLLARGIRSIAGQTTSQGLTYGHAPTVAYNCILPDFALTWILTMWDYYWQTGDSSIVRQHWNSIQRVLEYFDQPEARSKCGLLRYDTRLWYFGDWSNIYRGEIPTLINLWYVHALRQLSLLLAKERMSTESAAIAARAQAHERLAMKLLFDTKRQCFAGGLDVRLRRAHEVSVHDQVLALMLGLAPKAHPSMIQQFILPYLDGSEISAAAPSAFWCTYLLETMGARGYGERVMNFVRRMWSPMLATGTTWEGFTWDESGGSASHAWSAHPAFHCVNILAGIRQTAPSWSSVDICPCFAHGISHASALVPSPHGDIECRWERDGSSVRIRARVPRGVRGVLRAGTRKVSLRGGVWTDLDVALDP